MIFVPKNVKIYVGDDFLDKDFFEKLIAHYKCKIEDDEGYDKRIATEEREAYRAVKALSNSERPITGNSIKNKRNFSYR